MSYDADKSRQILDRLHALSADGDFDGAIHLLRHAEAAGTLRVDAGVLNDALGTKNAKRVIAALAFDPCPYCRTGREECDDCGGKGHYSGERVCRPCAGLGIRRCPFCNGTGLAGYDFVPPGLRSDVVNARLTFVINRLEEVDDDRAVPRTEPKELARHIVDLDQMRGVLANAAEFVGTRTPGAPGTRPAYSAGACARLLQNCARVNARAEEAIGRALRALAEHYGTRAQAGGVDVRKRSLYAHRAKHFLRLGGVRGFAGSMLETPRSLERSG